MKLNFSVFLLLVVTITTVHTLNGSAWRENVYGFLNEKKKELISGSHTNYDVCSEMKEHILVFEKKEILSKFDACDLSNSTDQCYYETEKIFHTIIDNSLKLFKDCTERNVCSIWNMEILLGRLTRGCFYFRSPKFVIKIWSQCTFMSPLFELSEVKEDLLRSTTIQNKCNKKPLDNISNAVKKAWQASETCEKEILMNVRKNEECLDKAFLREKYLKMSSCLDEPLNTLQQNIGNSVQVVRACAKISSDLSSELYISKKQREK